MTRTASPAPARPDRRLLQLRIRAVNLETDARPDHDAPPRGPRHRRRTGTATRNGDFPPRSSKPSKVGPRCSVSRASVPPPARLPSAGQAPGAGKTVAPPLLHALAHVTTVALEDLSRGPLWPPTVRYPATRLRPTESGSSSLRGMPTGSWRRPRAGRSSAGTVRGPDERVVAGRVRGPEPVCPPGAMFSGSGDSNEPPGLAGVHFARNRLRLARRQPQQRALPRPVLANDPDHRPVGRRGAQLLDRRVTDLPEGRPPW